jgi:hypothetical protein
MDKKCIWCLKDASETTFDKKAHTIPKSLGGKYICENVCDDCNHYFGSPSNQLPSVELIFKETFNITRARFLMGTNEAGGKNKPMTHFKSQYFKVDFEKNIIDVKLSFKFRKDFLSQLSRQFRRGLYKVFLEETERQNGNGHSKEFDFIRGFGRYDHDDLPVLYYHRKMPLILLGKNESKNPEFRFQNKMLFELKEHGFFDVEFLGHLFSFPITKNWSDSVNDYISKSLDIKQEHFYPPILVQMITDIDLTLSVMN